MLRLNFGAKHSNFTAINDRTSISMVVGWMSAGFNISVVNAFGNSVLVGSFGALGTMRYGEGGGLVFSNKTAGMVKGEGVVLGAKGGGMVSESNSILNTANNSNFLFGAGLFVSDKALSFTQTGRNIGYSLAYTPLVKATNFIKPLGYGTSAIGFIVGTYKFSVSNQSWGDYGQLGVSFLSSGLTISPYTAPFGIAIGAVDMFGGLNGFYNYLDNQEKFYNSTGGLILQINQYPVFIPITRP